MVSADPPPARWNCSRLTPAATDQRGGRFFMPNPTITAIVVATFDGTAGLPCKPNGVTDLEHKHGLFQPKRACVARRQVIDDTSSQIHTVPRSLTPRVTTEYQGASPS